MNNRKILISFLIICIITSSFSSPIKKKGEETSKGKKSTWKKIKSKRPKIKSEKKSKKIVVSERDKLSSISLNFDKWIEFVNKDWSNFYVENPSEEEFNAIQKKYEESQKIIQQFIEINLQSLKQENQWVENKKPENIDQLILPEKYIKEKPADEESEFWGNFTNELAKIIDSKIQISQKLILPKKSRTFVFGDFHGNFDALEKLFKNLIDKNVLNEQLKIQGNNYLIFLGDYIDRGQKGIEILLTLFKLKIQNPQKVVILRGNHECLESISNYGFLYISDATTGEKYEGELLEKLYNIKNNNESNWVNFFNSILYSFELMPATLFLGYKSKKLPIKFIELSHGAIDHRYNQEILLKKESDNVLEKINLENFIELESVMPEYKSSLDESTWEKMLMQFTDTDDNQYSSFNWSDIDLNPFKQAQIEESPRGAGFVYTTKFIEKYFEKISTEKNKVIKLIRGHEHSVPGEIRGYDKVGATPIGIQIITLMSGIYTTKGFDWGDIEYYPTFLELSPPNKKQIDWKIETKYLKDEEEQIDVKFEITQDKAEAARKILSHWNKYKKKRDEERTLIDEKFKNLKINKDLNYDKLLNIAKEFKDLQKKDDNQRLKKSLSEFISKSYFTGNNKEFAKLINELKYESNYRNYLKEKLIKLIIDIVQEEED